MTGKYFHTITDGKLDQQGIVLGSPEPGYYLVQTFEWVSGGDYCCYLVHIDTMKEWLFYSDKESFLFSYEYGAAHKYTRGV